MFSKIKAFTTLNKLTPFNKIVTRGIRNNFNKKLNNTGSTASSTSSYLKYALLGIGVGGFAYLSYSAGLNRDEKLRNLLNSGSRVNDKIILQRTKDTLSYFGAGLSLTSLLTFGMMRSQSFINFYGKVASRPILYLCLTIPSLVILMIGMKQPAIPENSLIKHGCWLGFNTIMSFQIAPFVLMAGTQLAAQAALITAGAVGGLAYISYISKNDSFLGLNGILAAGSGVITACAIASFFTNSALVHNVWLYGGLALFLAYVLYDVNQIKIMAERQPNFDPLSQSIHIYMDTINIFIRILMILENKKRK